MCPPQISHQSVIQYSILLTESPLPLEIIPIQQLAAVSREAALLAVLWVVLAASQPRASLARLNWHCSKSKESIEMAIVALMGFPMTSAETRDVHWTMADGEAGSSRVVDVLASAVLLPVAACIGSWLVAQERSHCSRDRAPFSTCTFARMLPQRIISERRCHMVSLLSRPLSCFVSTVRVYLTKVLGGEQTQ